MATIAAVSREGKPLQLDVAHVQALRGAMRGPVLMGGEPGYDESRTVWNAMIDRRPAVDRPLHRHRRRASPACSFAREHGSRSRMQGRRAQHRRARRSRDGGLLLDLSLMRGVWVDPAARDRARAGAAACWETSTARRSCTASPRCWASCRSPASRGSRSAAASATSRGASAGRATTCARWTW